MILQLAVENFKSISKRVVFSMLASNDNLHEDYIKNINNFKILPSSLIVGTNGAGKSNLFMALKYLQKILKEKENNINVFPHKLSEKNKPTQIDVQFIIDDIRYAYGIDVCYNQIVNEYLYVFKKEKQTVIFERDSENYDFYKDYYNEFNDVIKNYDIKCNLFLSLLYKYTNNELIKNTYNFFTDKIIIILSDDDEKNLFFQSLNDFKNNETQIMVNKLLSSIEIGINNFYFDNNEIMVKYDNMDININEESKGTKKLFSLLVMLCDVLINGKTIIFDELEMNLHISLVNYIINLFNTNKTSSQLIFSTHNTSLLNLSIFRRDQVWFMEKDLKNMSTDLYSLYNIVDVTNEENIEKGYILGKYGATFKITGDEVLKDGE